ncbi:MAG: Rne/Rng family ribonuclease [Gammaproteobacteria bacterium]|nr:Rne/Rng family ribonuclease [Gammaproteobacteria bacterium]
MKRMLINATQPEEVRVAVVDGQRLQDLDIESRGREQKKGSIYLARVTRVEPSLEAAFVDFGAERHGFLPLKEISRSHIDAGGGNRDGASRKTEISDLIREGQEFLVQVDKEERGTKGASLTTFFSLPGRYMVLMPNDPRAGGISRRLEGEDRDALREALSQLDIPDGMGVIVRTAGVGRAQEELQKDVDYLLQLWQAIQRAGKECSAPTLIYEENNLVVRAIRDCLREDIGELLIDSQEAFDEAQTFVQQVMPHYSNRIKLYSDDVPLFSRYQIESQIETAFGHTVKLPSGGSIVIDPTEALVAIDTNSARATKGADIEETALNTNLEAAEEIARQLRLRDVGGLIVIDFIDMSSTRNQRAVESRLREAVEADRARIQLGRISHFGLFEMSRQRLRPSLQETTTEVCPRCSGQGRIQDIQSLALTILRVMEEEALKERSRIVRGLVPLNVAAYLLNEKRGDVAEIEKRTRTHLVIVPNANLETPQYEIQRIREDSASAEAEVLSYELADATGETEQRERDNDRRRNDRPAQEAVIKPAAATPLLPAPEPPAPSLLQRLLAALFGKGTESRSQPEKRQPAEANGQRKRRNRKRDNRSNRRQRDTRPARNERRARGGGERRGGGRSGDRQKRAPRRPRADQDRGAKQAREQARERDDSRSGKQPREEASGRGDGRGRTRRGGQRRRPEAATAGKAGDDAPKRKPRRNRQDVSDNRRERAPREDRKTTSAAGAADDTGPVAEGARPDAGGDMSVAAAMRAMDEVSPPRAKDPVAEHREPNPNAQVASVEGDARESRPTTPSDGSDISAAGKEEIQAPAEAPQPARPSGRAANDPREKRRRATEQQPA